MVCCCAQRFPLEGTLCLRLSGWLSIDLIRNYCLGFVTGRRNPLSWATRTACASSLLCFRCTNRRNNFCGPLIAEDSISAKWAQCGPFHGHSRWLYMLLSSSFRAKSSTVFFFNFSSPGPCSEHCSKLEHCIASVFTVYIFILRFSSFSFLFIGLEKRYLITGETTIKRRVEEGKEECIQKRDESRRKKRRWEQKKEERWEHKEKGEQWEINGKMNGRSMKSVGVRFLFTYFIIIFFFQTKMCLGDSTSENEAHLPNQANFFIFLFFL